MPYKDGKRFTIAFNHSGAEQIEKIAAEQNMTPYALLKKIIVELLLKDK